MPEQQTVFITGATSGIGRACAVRLSESGFRVFGAGRSAPRVAELRGQGESARTDAAASLSNDQLSSATRLQDPAGVRSPGYTLLHVDVRNDESVAEAVTYIETETGRIDAVVNCAGVSVGGSAEEMSTEEARDQIETNFLGTVRICRAVLPHMRRRGSGRIVNISSIGGQMGMPFQSLYCASKYAIEGFSESLQMEIARFGIRVIVIEPGNTSTEQPDNRTTSVGLTESSDYREIVVKVLEEQARAERNGWSPDRVARTVQKALSTRRPRFRYRPGAFVERIAPTARNIIPDRLYLKIVASFFGM